MPRALLYDINLFCVFNKNTQNCGSTNIFIQNISIWRHLSVYEKTDLAWHIYFAQSTMQHFVIIVIKMYKQPS